METISWCSICNAKPADGILTIKEPGTGEDIPLPACLQCVAHIPKNDWIGGEIVIKQPEVRHE